MNMQSMDSLIDAVNEAEIILIGIGEEWTPSYEDILSDKSVLTGLEKLSALDNQNIMMSSLQKMYYESFHSEQLKKAYHNLFQLCGSKDYFLISLNVDRYPELAGFEKERCVYPCGNMDYLQCDMNCHNELLPVQSTYQNIHNIIKGKMQCSEFYEEKCPYCGGMLVYNTMEAKNYCEGGYLEQWEAYMKFLQKTINRKLCILELGVSMRFPGVIRNAFEKTTYYNQKAKMFRIHQTLADVPQNMEQKVYAKCENSVAYIANLFVS